MVFSLAGASPQPSGWLRGLTRILAPARAQHEFVTHATARVEREAAAPQRFEITQSTASSASRQDFERFFLEHERAISGYLWRMTGDEQAASDLAQETFLRAWQQFDRICGYDKPGAWLLRVATNLALQHLRQRAAPVGSASRLEEAWAPGASDPGRRFAERDLVRETLLALTPKARALLILREVQGLSADEVGAALKMSREAVKVGLWRARAQFREVYQRKEGQS